MINNNDKIFHKAGKKIVFDQYFDIFFTFAREICHKDTYNKILVK